MLLKVSFYYKYWKSTVKIDVISFTYFRIYTRALVQSKDLLMRNPNVSLDQIYNPVFRRGIFTVGLLMRYFDFSRPDVNGSNTNGRSEFENIFFDHSFYNFLPLRSSFADHLR